MQIFYHLCSLISQRILYTNNCRKDSADCKIQVRILRGKIIKPLLLLLGNNAAFVLEYEMIASDDRFFTVHRT